MENKCEGAFYNMDIFKNLSVDDTVHLYMKFPLLITGKKIIIGNMYALNFDLNTKTPQKTLTYGHFRHLYPNDFPACVNYDFDYRDHDFVTPMIIIAKEYGTKDYKPFRLHKKQWFIFNNILIGNLNKMKVTGKPFYRTKLIADDHKDLWAMEYYYSIGTDFIVDNNNSKEVTMADGRIMCCKEDFDPMNPSVLCPDNVKRTIVNIKPYKDTNLNTYTNIDTNIDTNINNNVKSNTKKNKKTKKNKNKKKA